MDWPATRAFAKEELPANECKNPIRILVLTNQFQSYRCSFVINAIKSCNDYYDALRKITKNILDFSSKLASIRSSHALVQKHTTSNSEASHKAWRNRFAILSRQTQKL